MTPLLAENPPGVSFGRLCTIKVVHAIFQSSPGQIIFERWRRYNKKGYTRPKLHTYYMQAIILPRLMLHGWGTVAQICMPSVRRTCWSTALTPKSPLEHALGRAQTLTGGHALGSVTRLRLDLGLDPTKRLQRA